MSVDAVAGCRDAPDLDVVRLAGRGRCRRPPRRRPGSTRRGARRRASGRSARAAARSTSTSICGTSVESSTCASIDAVDAARAAPRPRPPCRAGRRGRRRRCARRSARSAPVRTSSIRSLQVGLHVAVARPGSRRRPPGWRPASRRSRRFGSMLIQFSPKFDAVDLVGERAPGRCASRSCARRGSRAAPCCRGGDDARLLGSGGAGLGDPVHQEVALLEAREQRLAERRARRRARPWR